MGRFHLGNLGLDGKITSEWILKNWGVNWLWIESNESSESHRRRSISLPAEQPMSQEGLCSTALLP
jgi:hypothetical protein